MWLAMGPKTLQLSLYEGREGTINRVLYELGPLPHFEAVATEQTCIQNKASLGQAQLMPVLC